MIGCVVLALPHLTYPWGHDQGIYSACANVVLRGGIFPRDCFEPKQIGVIVMYAIPLAFTQATWGLHLFTLLWQAMTAIVVGAVARRMFHPHAAWFAGLFYFLIYVGINYWSTSQAETYANVFLALALLFVWLGGQRDARAAGERCLQHYAPLIIAGVCAGVTIWFKVTFGLYAVLMLLLLMLQTWLHTRSFQTTIVHALVFGLAVTSVTVAVLAYLALAGGVSAIEAWLDQIILFRDQYPLGPARPPSEVAWYLMRFLDNGADLSGGFKDTVPHWTFFGGGFHLLFVLAGIGVAAFARGRGTLMAYLLGSFVVGVAIVVMQAKYVQYHFTILHPPLALLAGAGAAAGLRALSDADLPRRVAGVAVLALTVLTVGALGVRMIPWVADAYTNVVEQRKSLRDIHLESHVAEQVLVADYIREHTAPDDTITIFGDAPWVYTLTQRRNATRFPFTDVWSMKPETGTYQKFMRLYLEDLQRNRPLYFIITQPDYPWPGVNYIETWKRAEQVHAWVEAHYQYEADNGPFILFRRRDSAAVVHHLASAAASAAASASKSSSR